jgi:hypothetical protein
MTFLLEAALVKLKHHGGSHLDYNYSLLWCVNYILLPLLLPMDMHLAVPWHWYVLYA